MDPIVFLRFDEDITAARIHDAAGSLADLDIAAGLVMPPVIEGITGRARSFDAVIGHGVQSADRVSGTTLANRDVTVQAIMRWDVAAQNTHGNPGTLIVRGKGNAAAEYHDFGIELRVVNAAALIGEIRFLWQDTAGVLKTQIGGHFQASSSWIMVTATRRWVSSTEVLLRYYLADELLAEVSSVDGSIGGGTTAVTSLGSRFTGGAYARFLAGAVDQVRVLDRELTHEEIRATWDRIATIQPRSLALVRDLHPPGFPISDNPASRVQRETMIWGNALGYAAAQAENVRANIRPNRAYGETLEQWEQVTGQATKLGDSIEVRRARVVARMSQRKGISIEGVKQALAPLVDTDVSNLSLLAFDQTVTEPFNSLRGELWDVEPAAEFSINAGTLRLQAAAGTYNFTGQIRTWKTARMSIGGDGRGVHIIAKINPTTLPLQSCAGVFLGDYARGNFVLLEVKHTGGVGGSKIQTEVFRNWVSTGAPVQQGNCTEDATVWLHLSQTGLSQTGPAFIAPAAGIGPFSCRFSEVSGVAGFVDGAFPVEAVQATQWAGLHFRGEPSGSISSTATDISFDDLVVRAPAGERSFHLYVYRDPALPGRPDLIGANNVISGLRQSHTHAAVVTGLSVLCDDETTGCDIGPTGGF